MGYSGLIGAVVGGIAEGGKVAQQTRDREAAIKHQEETSLAIKEAALPTLAEEGINTRINTQQERSQISVELLNLAERAVGLRGDQRTEAASRGVSGRSVEESALDVVQSESTQRSRLSKLQEFRELAAERRLRALSVRTSNQIRAGGRFNPIAGPNLANAGLSILGGALTGARAGQQVGDLIGNETSSLGLGD